MGIPGGLFTGRASLLTGAPGAAILYALAGIILYPMKNMERTEINSVKIAKYSLGKGYASHGKRQNVWSLGTLYTWNFGR